MSNHKEFIKSASFLLADLRINQKPRECNLNSVWFLFCSILYKYNFFFLDLQMLL